MKRLKNVYFCSKKEPFLFNEKEKTLILNACEEFSEKLCDDLKKEQDYTSGDWVDINAIVLVNLMI